METRVLGKSGLEVSRLGLGGLFVSGYGGNDPRSAAVILRRAAELGITYIDTAPSYADSEEVLGLAMSEVDFPFVLSTKLGEAAPGFDPQDQESLFASVRRSLGRLHRECIDLLMIHEPDRPGQYDWWKELDRFEGPVNEVLDELRARGLVRSTGLGGTTAYEMAHIIDTGRFDVVLTAFNYSVLWTEARIAVLPHAGEQNMGIVAGSPLQQGALAARFDDAVREGRYWLSPPRQAQFLALYQLCDDLDLALPELALRFVVSNPLIDCVLTGARSIAELEASVEAIERGALPEDVLGRLAEIGAMVPFRPWEEPFNLPFRQAYRGPGKAS
jgi:aryl-alcohol dehydrogenase-like predicted oxidoreductase